MAFAACSARAAFSSSTFTKASDAALAAFVAAIFSSVALAAASAATFASAAAVAACFCSVAMRAAVSAASFCAAVAAAFASAAHVFSGHGVTGASSDGGRCPGVDLRRTRRWRWLANAGAKVCSHGLRLACSRRWLVLNSRQGWPRSGGSGSALEAIGHWPSPGRPSCRRGCRGCCASGPGRFEAEAAPLVRRCGGPVAVVAGKWARPRRRAGPSGPPRSTARPRSSRCCACLGAVLAGRCPWRLWACVLSCCWVLLWSYVFILYSAFTRAPNHVPSISKPTSDSAQRSSAGLYLAGGFGGVGFAGHFGGDGRARHVGAAGPAPAAGHGRRLSGQPGAGALGGLAPTATHQPVCPSPRGWL